MTKSNNTEQHNGAGFFLILTILFLGISVWQTAQGYELLLGTYLAWFFSFAVGLMMLFLAFEMRKRKVRGESAGGPLAGYCACALFCFLGNFNAIYSRYNREELYKNELQSHKQELVGVSTSAITALGKADTLSLKLKKDVEQHEGQLLRQIMDPSNLGLGQRAQEEIAVLEELLQQKLTRFSGPPQMLIRSYQDNIDHILSSKLSESKLFESKKLIKKIETERDSTLSLLDLALKTQNVSSMGQTVIAKSVDVINEIGTETQNFVGKTVYIYPEAIFENQELGKISYTFKSAFNGRNTAAAIVCMMLAIAIDALVPFVIFVGTRRQDGNDGYSSYPNGDKGGVAILR